MQPLRAAAWAGLLWAALGATAAQSGAEVRTWTSHTGSEFVGSLQEERDGAVVLAGASGKEVEVPLEQLSAQDRAYLRTLQRERHETTIAFFRAGRFDEADIPERAEINRVRHVVQKENFCVPASAEMVLRFHGLSYDQDYLARLSSRDSARSAGTNFGDLMRAMRNLWIDSVSLMRGDGPRESRVEAAMTGIRAAVAKGFPVLISYETASLGHAVTVVRYDDRRRALWVLDPAQNSSSRRLDYKVIERLLTGAVVVIPAAGTNGALLEENSGERDAFLSRISGHLRTGEPEALRALAEQLEAEGIAAQWRNLNRRDLGSSQGQTRSFARQQGVEFVRLALERGLVVVAPQQFDSGPGLILVYGFEGNLFRSVEFYSDGNFRRGEVRPLDFSLRWVWRNDRTFLLPVLEVELPSPPRL